MDLKNSNLFLMLVGMLVTILSYGAHASAAHRFVKIDSTNVKNVHCFYVEPASYIPFAPDEFQFKVDELIIAREGRLSGGNRRKFDRCNAAVFQALQRSSALYVDIDSAEVIPENGFFVQKSQCR